MFSDFGSFCIFAVTCTILSSASDILLHDSVALLTIKRPVFAISHCVMIRQLHNITVSMFVGMSVYRFCLIFV